MSYRHNVHAQKETHQTLDIPQTITLMQNTARQSKPQDRQTRCYLRLTRQSCRLHRHYTVHTTNMPRWHSLRAPKSLGPYILLSLSISSPSYILSLSLLILLRIPASAACLNTYHNRPSHPVCRLPITNDRNRESATVHTRYHTWTGDHHHRRRK